MFSIGGGPVVKAGACGPKTVRLQVRVPAGAALKVHWQNKLDRLNSPNTLWAKYILLYTIYKKTAPKKL